MTAGPNPHWRRDVAETAYLAEVIFDLKQRHTYRQIEIITAAPDGPTGGKRITRGTACGLIRQHIEEVTHPKLEEWRTLQVERLEARLRDHLALRDAHWDRAMGSEENAPEVPAALAVDRALNGYNRTIEQQSKILGIYVTRIEAQVTEVTQQDIALQEMVAELKVKNAAIEAGLRAGREHPE